MKASELREAQLIAAARDANVAMRKRLADGESLKLMLGQGGEASAIVLTPAYCERIRADLVAAFDLRIAENDAALAARGVEP